ncbi:hypothetical protein AB1K89_07070 [Sporosarcina sp. 179-K 8C2 HS]|uniref:hypothetical protein n=1 Tax=Sporosarcina sp. 179-K 8C2 HS TaxID=3142387 RepID=UPI0039A03744
MLPEILKIAEGYGVTFNQRTYGKKETLCKCVFCEEDSKPGKGHKFYLSLNTQDQLYKCWFCGTSGGVLDFETKLSGLPFDDIRKKYFGTRMKKLHPAERLNARQLRTIGWAEYKRKNRAEFKKNRESVLRDWKRYEHEQLVKHYAMFIVVAHIENQEERQDELLQFVMKSCRETQIHLLFNRILAEYAKEDAERTSWAIEGTEIGRAAWRVSLSTFDFEMEKVVINVTFLYYMLKMKNLHCKRNSVTIDKVSLAN